MVVRELKWSATSIIRHVGLQSEKNLRLDANCMEDREFADRAHFMRAMHIGVNSLDSRMHSSKGSRDLGLNHLLPQSQLLYTLCTTLLKSEWNVRFLWSPNFMPVGTITNLSSSSVSFEEDFFLWFLLRLIQANQSFVYC
ncbi:uncharacterized protein PHALS_15138 [Plasmopara halstedii]|uniref:Uncharacterized protein n=1 Tax=Plasmopara halstedii TaxID=4781 RepID=A0A0P1ABS0_PLAHL|nr:uncharacterized protein PHALS_15138 [Plasmopara halstedii]CEG38025.1 hypothetical protein PHALS_15138 [Plasmopara halstedii]|eukprot:XP_024574394.1 hypothetical protein PHALS_15138 [Plasmopara halstedii]